MAGLTPSGTQEVLPTPARKKYSTGSSHRTSSPSMTLTHPPFCIDPLAVALPLTSPSLPLLLPFLAPGRCFRTWVLTTYQFFYLSLFRSSRHPLPSTFGKLAGMTLSPALTSTILLQRNTRLFFSSAAAFFTSLALNVAKSFIPFGRIKRPPKAWWSAEVEDAVSERRKAFAAVHRSDEDRRAFIFASRRASSVIAKARLRHGRQLALLFHSNQTRKLYTLFSALSLALLPRLPPLLISLTVLLPGNRLQSTPLT